MRSSAEQVKSLQITQFVSNDKQKLRNLWLTEKSCGVFSIDSPPPPFRLLLDDSHFYTVISSLS